MNYCKTCNQQGIDKANTIKGFEVSKGQYVQFTEQDFENIPLESIKSVRIDRFVGFNEVDPMLFELPYHLAPEEIGLKPYQLLAQTMSEQQKVALGKITLSNKEQLVALRAKDGGIIMSTMYYADEIRTMPSVGEKVVSTDSERQLLGQVVKRMTKPFDHLAYHDTYAEALNLAIQTKQNGGTITALPEKQGNKSVSLEDALKAMLNEGEAEKPKSKKGK
jgi:DNA end-binding protein Ku